MPKMTSAQRIALRWAMALFVATLPMVQTTAGEGSVTYPYEISTLAGSPINTGSPPLLKFQTGIACDAQGNTFVANTGANSILKVSAQGVISVVAGAASISGSADGPVASATFYVPRGVAADPNGNLYVADTGNSKIRVITPAGIVSTLAGGNANVQDGTGASAGFEFPEGIVYSGGNLYVADTQANLIRKVTLSGVVTTLAGGALQSGADGAGSAASFTLPAAIAADATGNLYVADAVNQKIRRVDLNGVVTTIASSLSDEPTGVAVDSGGQVYYSTPFLVAKVSSGGSETLLGSVFKLDLRS